MNPEAPVVLIGTSLNEASYQVVRNGVRIARAAGAKIHLVHAYDLTMLYSGAGMGGGIYLPELIEAESASRLQRLEDQAWRLGIQREELAGLTAIEGVPHRVLADAAAGAGASLIVVGAAESWGRLSKLLGSTADRVVRAAACPVLAVRGELELPPRRVLIAVDLSPASGDAMRRGLQVLAVIGGGPWGRPRTAIEALYVEESALLEIMNLDVDEPRGEAEAAAELERFIAANLPEPGWQVRGRVRTATAADREILGRCEEVAPDLVVLGTHGRSGFERFLIGSVAESVMRHAQSSVLIVPPAAAAKAAQSAQPVKAAAAREPARVSVGAAG
ncbi:MAG TPA: universal stress protein [Thermoanaerobaculia bacterium]|nr:universal stress protein [Thermoanaerobaculia bacterium]